jgi:hypothetical protein
MPVDVENSAGRIWSLARNVHSINPNLQVFQGWATLFHVAAVDEQEVAHEVGRLLRLLIDQARAAADGLTKHTNLPPANVATAYDAVTKSASITAFSSQWGWVRGIYTPEVLTRLEDYQFMLPVEDHLEVDEVSAIQAQLQALQEQVDKADLSFRLQQFLREQLSIMERALRDYRVQGAAAFRTASDRAAISIIENADLVREHGSTPVVRETLGFWPRLEKTCKRVVLIGATLHAISKGLHEIPPMVEQLTLPPASAVESPMIDSPIDEQSSGPLDS